MYILAWETTQRTGSVAVLTGDRVLLERPLDAGLRSAQSLLPAVRDLLAELGWQRDEVELVATTVGPGSFTGLRVGVTAAKTWAYALGSALVGVDTLEAIAAGAIFAGAVAEGELVTALCEAERDQVFAATYRALAGARWEETSGVAIVDSSALGERCEAGWVAGPVLGRLASRLPAQLQALPTEHWAPQAGSVGRCAFRAFQAGRRDDPWQMAPQYYRPSAAEERKKV